MSATTVTEATMPTSWGRAGKATWFNTFSSLALITGVPCLLHINWIALEQFDGSITAALGAAFKEGPITFAFRHFPEFTMASTLGYVAWLLFQAALYSFLPGPGCYGQRTPGGHLLKYFANGLLAWTVTHGMYIAASYMGLVDPAIIAKHWEGMLVAVNVYGFVLAIVSQLKGNFFPSYPEDCKFSGSLLFDFWGGVELNPRFGEFWDWKFFHNGRPGIVAWSLIDLSYAAYQYQLHGHVTTSMMIVTLFHTIYVVDFFYNEDWYTRTIDISHDHFGFMLAWGDTTFLPTFYTLQTQYLARYPTYLTRTQSLAILAFGLSGYFIFRSANFQRDHVRAHDGNTNLWGKPAEVIRVKYQTSDGKTHNSLLLTSGWWGFSRHANYLGDLMLTWSMCAVCGFTHFIPWSYFFYMSILLYHRSIRDDARCRTKYGKHWDEYCRKVPYVFVPGVI
ncbi:hypothetical protein BT93_L4869 [Corymbia citriodora subsp. variegata]|uniref:7-dehydrocholesterol reductase n=1 Tax=Corymbia citriodora subsp. variegata TaxID=360336 RepID=A0A8T0CHI3_CORYI|nr:hypothetical protein BT93_L4869 [Corymbia citriodora subsp. variegata]